MHGASDENHDAIALQTSLVISRGPVSIRELLPADAAAPSGALRASQTFSSLRWADVGPQAVRYWTLNDALLCKGHRILALDGRPDLLNRCGRSFE